jgi:hypothetical protein
MPKGWDKISMTQTPLPEQKPEEMTEAKLNLYKTVLRVNREKLNNLSARLDRFSFLKEIKNHPRYEELKHMELKRVIRFLKLEKERGGP